MRSTEPDTFPNSAENPFCGRTEVSPPPNGVPTESRAPHDDDLTDMPEALGRFRVQAVLGQGGMGVVYKAFDPLISRVVALKVIRRDLVRDSARLKQLLREARAAAAPKHPHVVTVYDLFADNDSEPPFLVMEYVPGPSLADILHRQGRLIPFRATRFAIEVLSALSYAHDLGFVHRDVKPANVLIDKRIDQTKIADFGLARCLEELRARRGRELAGTLCYMAPEQIDGEEECDGRADLFAMGIVLFQMVTGRLPFTAPTTVQMMACICSQPAPDPRSIEPSVPEALSRAIARALRKDPEQRYPTAVAFIADLQEYMNDCQWSECALGCREPKADASELRELLRVSQARAPFHARVWIQPSTDAPEMTSAVVARDHRAACHVGARIRLTVQASADCFVTLIDVGTSGRLSLLLENHALSAGAPVALRGPGGLATWEVGRPPGVEQIKALFTKRPLVLPSELPPVITPTLTANTRDIVDRARDLPVRLYDMLPDDWTDAVCQFLIQEP